MNVTSPGELSELLTGRVWDARTVRRQWQSRAVHYADAGIGRGDLVFLHHGNSLEFFGDLLALWALGACAAPVDPRLTAFEIEMLARATRPRVLLSPSSPRSDVAATLAGLGVATLESPRGDHLEDFRDRIRRTFAAPAPDHDALVLFTSGTTGSPKAVVHTHRSLGARWAALRARLDPVDLERTLCLLPTHFGHGLICNALYPWLSGHRLAVLPPFRSEVILQLGDLVDEHGITFMSSVPALWRLALRAARPPRTGTLRRVCCGSAPLSAAMWRGIAEWTRSAAVSNVYGLTETASWLAGSAAGSVPEDGLIGEPWEATLKVTAAASATPSDRSDAAAPSPGTAGPVWVRTRALMRGYLGRDDLTAEAVRHGWLRTGDIGSLDAAGRLYLCGRERDEINRGGLKVYAGDVDAVVQQFTQVLDACAFAYDDGSGEEKVAVAVVLSAADIGTLRRLYGWARERLAGYQLPRCWFLVDEIPRTASGKVNRSQMAARCAALRPVGLNDLAPNGSKGVDDV